MKTLILACMAISLISATVIAQANKILPYDQHVDEFPNGLKLVTVPTDYKNLVSLYIVVRAGSRHEIEAKKSGYAHFFEHLMFRGSEKYPPGSFDEVMKRAGASSNAYTSDDRTVYHETFAKEDLEEVIKLEADRFQHLKFSEEQYKTEAGAVLGEYNKNSASPFFKLHEVVRETAFKKHTYSHTTMGYIADIIDYPNQYEYAWKFFNRFYRPENTTIIIVGDITREKAFGLVKSNFSDWKRGNYKPEIPVEPAQEGPRSTHIDWASQTLPILAVAYRAPEFSETKKDKAALDMFATIAFGETSEINQKLVLKEQKTTFIAAEGADRVDPELFTIYAQLKNPADFDYVRTEVLKTVTEFSSKPVSQQKLDETRSRMRYGFAMGMNSNDAIAGTLATYVSMSGSPETLNNVFKLYDSLTPADIQDAAKKYLSENNRTIVTLATKTGGAK